MLKALELHGFKSFADKTRFEFPAGITVVVGPNGSGKSNIVDAIKWVLGEQSAKSLRGKDMADVIFKGSGASGRKPMNTAEATLVLDNSEKRLPIDAPEVHITRRVYRSGEGEYLINRQPCRLKDIRDLFRGTGVGGDAYSLIEQGKVDRLLQASAKDRRAMFEEAAGISRFKAKKVESQRRLERVEQNMLRLSDIVEEVENRLKTVRAQAGKARRYREYSERLQQLRTQIALVDWRRLSGQLESIEAELIQAQTETQSADAQAQRLEARQLELETAVLIAAEEARNCESQLAQQGQQIAGEQATIEHEKSRALELGEQAALHGKSLLSLCDKAGDVRERLRATQAEVAAAEIARSLAARELADRDAFLVSLAKDHAGIRQATDTLRQQYVTQLQRAAALAGQVETHENRLAAMQQAIAQHQRQVTELTSGESDLSAQAAQASEREKSLAEQSATHAAALESAENELAESRNLHASRSGDLAQLHGRQQGIAERTGVLEEFERTLEGIGSGVKQVLARAGIRQVRREGEAPAEPMSSAEAGRSQAEHPWSLVQGVVADYVQAGIEHAGAIDVALGEMAQAVVIDRLSDEIQAVVQAGDDLTGRVVVVGMPGSDAVTAGHPSSLEPLELTAEMVNGVQVVGRADKLIECAEAFRPLAKRLLGRTFVVRSLRDALVLQSRAPAGARFVTLGGELVDEQGAIAFGPRQSATSLVSRRSQLRASRLDLAVLDQQIIDAQRETAHLKREIERHEQSLRGLVEQRKTLDHQSAKCSADVAALAQRLEQFARQKVAAQQVLAEAAASRETIDTALKQVSLELSQAQAAADGMKETIAQHDDRISQLDRERQEAAALTTAAKVELARCEQRLEGLKLRSMQFEDDSRERDKTVGRVREQLDLARQRQAGAQLTSLNASSRLASLLLSREAASSQLQRCAKERDAAAAERTALSDELNRLRRRAIKLREKEHQLSLSAEQVRHERRTLADRLREDYRIELAELTHEPSPEEAEQRAAVEEEIETLRRKINQIGAVNLDALEELDELENRFALLDAQHKDLTQAKQSLERIIHKINADSRRLFLETLEAIRVNFQALYRKAFGGGKADIVLEEGVDVLECGVEIIATPPGKPSFNNSLLSGGEKALTAVALLLGIFQFRPSPFCVLDEVDAPFDEANIGRFIEVLKDFLGWTRFVIVTHSKKTMTAATTLYGITMQESGVSKRVSVRFDDVSEDGHISREALDRAPSEKLADEKAENAA